ncbi:MAG: hypothetical protein U0M02_11600 [Acutalibacteraceae bacterium]|nr:hypothetical protein [Acutalibacteraceae bacterium]
MESKRITLFAGHYGSGKTNIAVNYALRLKEEYDKVVIADLDIVNPYFRSKDSEKQLEARGIHLISSEYANTNVDVPAMPSEAYSIIDDKTIRAVIDVGGDDRGALAMGRYAPAILSENDYEMLLVINKFRPLTRDCASTLAVMTEIETACGMKFTGIINNSNLGDETTAEDVISSASYANGISEVTGLPVKMTTVKEELYDTLKEKVVNCTPIKLYVKQSWAKQEEDLWQK